MYITVSKRVEVTHQLIGLTHYKFGKKVAVNSRRNTIIKLSMKGSTKGYYIAGDFYSLKELRGKLEKIPNEKLPF